MKRHFQFTVTTRWTKGQFENTKSHISEIEGKESLKISAAREFKGDATAHNPEDLLLQALSSCHMMSYFYVCQQNDVEVLNYKDTATAYLNLQPDASGKIDQVILQPIVTIIDFDKLELAEQLHRKAHELCFIANSVDFEINIDPTIRFRKVG